MKRYYSIMRPVSIGTYPKPKDNKILKIFNYDIKTKVSDAPRSVWGYIEYEKPLTNKEMLDYELIESQEEICQTQTN